MCCFGTGVKGFGVQGLGHAPELTSRMRPQIGCVAVVFFRKSKHFVVLDHVWFT